jgi:hypothetical protein
MFFSQEKPISQLGPFEKPIILVAISLISCSFILMVLKIRPLTSVNFKCKVQLHFAHIKDCDIVVNVFFKIKWYWVETL